jgi:2-dehydro-3-deoxyglucarate aldolase/4-hydroxy-2-oxoheptanedioate aldolase
MTRHGRVKIGTFIVEFNTPGIGHILKAGGADYAFVDLEHSGFGFDTLKSMIRYMQAAELPTLVRVPSQEYHHVARALDVGAEGIMAPMIGSADDAKRLLSYIKYPPQGARGVAVGIGHDDYTVGPVLKKLRDANKRTTFFVLIETEEGAENADEIAAINGVDALWIGHFDMTVSMGIPGQFDHPKFKAAVKKIVAAGKKHNKTLGRLVPDVKTGTALYKEGFDFICYSGDVWLLQQAFREGADALRKSCKGGRKRGGK